MRKNSQYLTIVFCIAVSVTAPSWGVEIFNYEPKGKRDPFVPLIGSGRNVSTGLEGIVSIEDVNLEGIAMGAKGKWVAIINGQLMKEDDKAGSLMIKRIADKKVTLSIDDKVYDVTLPEEGGAKSEK